MQSLLALLQHHGFPTPLLDWTRSPFVASYFAFKGNLRADSFVRIYNFNKKAWSTIPKPEAHPNHHLPLVSMLEVTPYANQRYTSQQAESMFSTIDDIEEYISIFESTYRQKLLQAYDIPAHQQAIALQELKLMGITPSSILQSLDGLCIDLRESMFSQ